MAKVQYGEEILPKVSTPPRVGRRTVTDDRRICDSKDLDVNSHVWVTELSMNP